ncbi:Transposable element Tcb2 transposase [Anabarilius grahami]|uniref:Transposable element Tcb2 transposase n=1 Tax=Anabarilius grahami TaxID=495550 RepID=A0A3N0XGM8_ANAGA|nr:Transposable element Tcb2 transposase [Anabarilius grahami]
MPQMSQVLRERATGMLTAGMSTISRLQRRFREFGSTSNQPYNRRPRVTTPAQDLHIQHLHPQDRLRPATRTAAATIGLHNQRISAQTVRNRFREAHLHARHLHARRPHRGLDLTAVHCHNRLEWANAHIRWRLALWRGVLFTDESRFSLYRADGRQRVWRRVGERFAVVAHGGGGVMVWSSVCYEQKTQVHFIDGILNAQRYRDEILSPIVMPFSHDHHLMLQHDNARPHVLEAETSQFLHGQHTHWTCHPLSMFGMLWIGVYDSVFQYLSISSNFAQPLKRSGPTFHRPQDAV